MKQYNRTTKKYEDATDIKLKKRELCRGGKEHDFLLVLPDFMTYDDTYKFNPEAYYELLEEREKREIEMEAKIKALGIVSRYKSSYFTSWIRRYYVCSTCKKKRCD